MMLLAVTTETWVVTGLGFGMVLVLLFVFVYIMKGLGAIMNRATAGTKKAETKVADDATKAAIATTLALDKDSEEMAAVAMALDMYYNSLHDVQVPQITIRHHETMWNKK
ncbi:MAG: OadG family protein [Paludibacteraceae bacterium]|nr:OadG family protein [Paludibacteraceae bacterium]